MRIVFSGGGTGGHIFPAIAVADEVLKRHPEAQIMFVGALGKMEMEKIPKAGFPIKGLWISGFQRKLTLSNLLFPIKLVYSLVQSYFILKRFKPDLVAGFGGFASGAALFMAGRLGIPTLIQEQNSYPGVTNRILGRTADRICIAYENARRYFAKDRSVLTGNPVRGSIVTRVTGEEAKAHFGLDPSKKTAFITGGSLGAKTLNEAMKWSFDELRDEEGFQVIWQCGSLYYDEYRYSSTANLPHVTIMDFIDKMELAYAASDLVVSRSGALTVSEIATAGKAAILIPSPNVAEDHQTKNAMALVDVEAAVLLNDKEAVKVLGSEMRRVLKDKELMGRLEENVGRFADLRATEKIADELLSLKKDR